MGARSSLVIESWSQDLGPTSRAVSRLKKKKKKNKKKKKMMTKLRFCRFP